jgi:predicted Holliday junction resolvase-like endonuclease
MDSTQTSVPTQILTPYIVTLAIILVVFVIVIGFAIVLTRSIIRRFQSGQGPLGASLQQSRVVATERLQVERELLAAQKETNQLLKQIIEKKR